MSSEKPKRRLLIVAGEASADLHAAALLSELKRMEPSLTCYGVGGDALAAEGMEITVDARALNVVGISDWFDRAGEVVGSYRKLMATIRERKPDCALLLDLPDFNLMLAKKLKKMGVPVVYYISPQVWAWRKYRVRKIQKNVARMLVVFPFEKEFYQTHGVDVEFVGHPLLDSLSARPESRSHMEVLAAPRIALLPGSRQSEIKYHGDIIQELASRLKAKFPEATLRVPVASTLSRDFVEKSLGKQVELVDGKSRQVLEWADLAVVASGTATLETALIGTPFCLFYKVSPSSAWIFNHLVRYRGFIGMPNLLHGREVVKEFFQANANAGELFGECERLVEDSEYRQRQSRELLECREKLGKVGASRRAAEQVASVLGEKVESRGLSL